MRPVAICLLALVAVGAQAQFTTYFRTANSGSGTTPFRVGTNVGVPGSATVRWNNNGELVATLSDTLARSNLFRGTSAAGAVVYVEPNTNTGISSPVGFSDAGRILFAYTFGGPGGIYQVSSSGAFSLLTNGQPLGNTGWASPSVNNHGRAAWRGTVSSSNVWAVLEPNGLSATTVATVGQTVTQGSGSTNISFLFTPNLNDQNRVFGAVGLGASTTVAEIRSFGLDGSSVTLVGLGNPTLYAFNFNALSNLMAVNNNGELAFFGRVGSDWGLYRRAAAGAISRVALAQSGTQFNTTDFTNFNPAINDNGVIVFRARDGRPGQGNVRTIYFARPDNTVSKLISEGETFVDSSTGNSVRLGWDATLSAGAIYGTPQINNQNQIAAMVVVTDPVVTSQRLGGMGIVSNNVLGTPISGTVTFNNWIGGNRAYTVEVRDAGTDALLESRAFSSSGSTGSFSFTSTLTGSSSVKVSAKPAGGLRASVAGALGSPITANLVIRPGDVDANGEVDLTDIDLIIGQYLNPGPLTEDLDGNGEVDLTDIDIAIGNYLEADN